MQTASRDLVARLYARSALAWLLLAALMGVWLRWQQWGQPPVQFSFRFLTHAHSHLMFLGWVFNALVAGLTGSFLPESVRRMYGRFWWGLQVCLAGMALSFPVQGYGPVSIAFSTVHMALAAWLVVRILLDAGGGGNAHIALRWAVFFLFLSSVGPFALGFVMAKGLQATIWYNLAVYFYLHFQYNGWMVFALLAILLRKTGLEDPPVRGSVRLLAAGCLAGFAISTLWTQPPPIVYAVAALGAGLQVWGSIGLLFAGRRLAWSSFWHNRWAFRLAGLALCAFCLKLILQVLASLPGLGAMVFLNRNWLIAYFHLVFIGVISLLLAAIFMEQTWLPRSRNGIRWWLLIGGFLGTELILALPQAPAGALLAAAVMMLLGLLWVVASGFLSLGAASTKHQLTGK